MRRLRPLVALLFLAVSVAVPARAQGTRIKDLPLATSIPTDARLVIDGATLSAPRGITVAQLATNVSGLAIANKLDTTNGVAVGLTTATAPTTGNSVVNKTALDAAIVSGVASKLNATNGAAIGLTVNGGTPSLLTRATSSLYFGDSVVEGSSASTVAATWWRLVADSFGWTYTNLAFGGAVVTDLNWQSQPGYTHTNYLNSILYTTPIATATNLTVFAKVGINDGSSFPNTSGDFAAYLTHYYQSWLCFAANWATPGKTLATAATESGTWTDWTNYFGSVSGNKSTTSGDTLTFETQGDAIYVAFPVSLTNTTSFGNFWISIDGTAVELVTPNGVGFGNRNQWTTPVSYIPFSATNAFWAKRYSGYGSRRHTVLVTATNNASLATVINWVAGSQQPLGPNSGPSLFLLENLNRAADSTRDATYASLRAQVNMVGSLLSGDGLQVAVVNPNSTYNSANSGDGVHPNDAGMLQVAQSVIQRIDAVRGLPITSIASTTSTTNLTTAGSGLTATGSTIKLGGTLTENTTLSGGAYGLAVSRTATSLPAIKATIGASTYGVQVDADSSFMEVHTSSGTPSFYARKVRGTVASQTAVQSGDTLGRYYFMGGTGGGNFEFGASIESVAAETFTSSASGSSLLLSTTPIGTDALVTALTLAASGAATLSSTLGVTGVVTGSSNATFSGTIKSQPASGSFGFHAATDGNFPLILDSSATPNAYFRRVKGTIASPTAVLNGDFLARLNVAPFVGAGTYQTSALITALSTQDHSVGAAGSKWEIYATTNGSATPVLRLTIAPGTVTVAENLAVTGAASASGITSTTTGTGLALDGDGTFAIIAARNSNSGAKEFAFQRSRAGSTAVQSGDVIGTLGFFPYNGASFSGRRAGVRAQATENMSVGVEGTSLILAATPTGSATLVDQLTVNGNSVAVAGSATVVGNISGQTLTSTVATGTAPLTVASTTLVSNLNADRLDGLNKGGIQPASANLTNVAALTAQSLPSTIISVTENTQVGTTYTVLSTDNGKVVTLNNGSAITVTVPTLSAGFSCTFIQKGAGQVTFTASGTTVSNAHSQTKTFGQYAVVTLYGLSSTAFVLAGDTGT